MIGMFLKYEYPKWFFCGQIDLEGALLIEKRIRVIELHLWRILSHTQVYDLLTHMILQLQFDENRFRDSIMDLMLIICLNISQDYLTSVRMQRLRARKSWSLILQPHGYTTSISELTWTNTNFSRNCWPLARISKKSMFWRIVLAHFSATTREIRSVRRRDWITSIFLFNILPSRVQKRWLASPSFLKSGRRRFSTRS